MAIQTNKVVVLADVINAFQATINKCKSGMTVGSLKYSMNQSYATNPDVLPAGFLAASDNIPSVSAATLSANGNKITAANLYSAFTAVLTHLTRIRKVTAEAYYSTTNNVIMYWHYHWLYSYPNTVNITGDKWTLAQKIEGKKVLLNTSIAASTLSASTPLQLSADHSYSVTIDVWESKSTTYANRSTDLTSYAMVTEKTIKNNLSVDQDSSTPHKNEVVTAQQLTNLLANVETWWDNFYKSHTLTTRLFTCHVICHSNYDNRARR